MRTFREFCDFHFVTAAERRELLVMLIVLRVRKLLAIFEDSP